MFQGSVTKKRRSVAFKKQNYHSVYEYPKEVVALSPAYSEPQMGGSSTGTSSWERSFAGTRFGVTPATLAPTTTTAATATGLSGATTDLTGLDGFTVSSSQRPFLSGIGGSQFSPQCHNTWPTADADFSWSQIQVRQLLTSLNRIRLVI